MEEAKGSGAEAPLKAAAPRMSVRHVLTEVMVTFGVDDGDNCTPQPPLRLQLQSLTRESLDALLQRAAEHRAAVLDGLNGRG